MPSSLLSIVRRAADDSRARVAALLLLPATFLHFFLIFPRPTAIRPVFHDPNYASKRRRWLALLTAIYAFLIFIFTVSSVHFTWLQWIGIIVNTGLVTVLWMVTYFVAWKRWPRA